MYCANCGTQLAPGLSYCNRCGFDLRERNQANTGIVIALLSAIILVGLIGLGIMLGGAISLRQEAGLSQELIGVFMLFTFLLISTTEFMLVRNLSRLLSSKERKNRSQPVLPVHHDLRLPQASNLGEPVPSVTENTTRTLSTRGVSNENEEELKMKKLLSLFVLLPLLTAGCHHGRLAEVQGSGKRQTEKRQVAPFTSISTEGAFDIEVVCQKDLSLEIEADDNILPLVSTDVSGNILHLKPTKNYSVSDAPKVKITVPNLEAISANGAGKIQISGVNNEKLQISSDGAPAITVSGTTKMVGIDTNGAAKIDTHNLRATHAIVDSKGVSKVDLGVSDKLDVNVSGPSRVTYKGDPVINKTIHGPGKVEKRADEGA